MGSPKEGKVVYSKINLKSQNIVPGITVDTVKYIEDVRAHS